MSNSFLEKQIEKCIEDDARRSITALRRLNISYCGLLTPRKEQEVTCVYKGGTLVIDTNMLSNQRLREVYECLYFKGDAA